MTDLVRDFYEELADEYHLMFADWRQEIPRQGEALDRLIRREAGSAAASVLDFVRASGVEYRTSHHASRFRALRRAEVDDALQAAGFRDIRWHSPADSGFYQPVVTVHT